MFKILAKSQTSLEHAQALDKQFPPLAKEKFKISTITPLAGHSLGPPFIPSEEAASRVPNIRANDLHAGHWTNYDSSESAVQDGNWFDCDIEPHALEVTGKLLGFSDPSAFCFGRELSVNLALLLIGFYRNKNGHEKITYLETEFTSDQQVFRSIVENKLQTIQDIGVETKPTEHYLSTIPPEKNGLYNEDTIIAYINENAASLSVIMLSEIVFTTGQRLDIQKIMDATQEARTVHNLVVGLDLAHVVGNRPTHLEAYGVHFAVGCGYKFLSQNPGNPFGWYIRPDISTEDFKVPQGWKAIDSKHAFQNISKLSPPETLHQTGAKMLRISNPAPQSIVGTQVYIDYLVNTIGLDTYVEQSERLTTFLMAGLREVLGDKLDLKTPEDPTRRGATLAFTIEGVDIKALEDYLKEHHHIEVDTRPPVMRVMAHALYNTHEDIARLLEGIKAFLNSKNNKS